MLGMKLFEPEKTQLDAPIKLALEKMAHLDFYVLL